MLKLLNKTFIKDRVKLQFSFDDDLFHDIKIVMYQKNKLLGNESIDQANEFIYEIMSDKNVSKKILLEIFEGNSLIYISKLNIPKAIPAGSFENLPLYVDINNLNINSVKISSEAIQLLKDKKE